MACGPGTSRVGKTHSRVLKMHTLEKCTLYRAARRVSVMIRNVKL